MTIPRCLLLAAALAALAAELPAQQMEMAPPAVRWEWTIAPSVFAPSQSGSVALTGMAYPGQMANPSPGGALYLQGKRGDWAFVLDGYYLGMEQPYFAGFNPNGSGLDSGATTGNQWALQILALRRVTRGLEFSFGLAANGVQATASAYGFTGSPGPSTPFAITSTETKNWALPVAGLRWTPVDRDRWRVAFFGEGGYWGSNNKMWQLVPSVGYRIGPVVEVAAQYRWLNTMYKESGDFNVFAYTVHSYGPELALALRF